MTLKWAPLAVTVILGLGCAATGGEDPAPAPVAQPAADPAYPAAPATPATGSDSSYVGTKSWGWGPCDTYSLPFSATFMYLLAPVILGFFISGLIRHRHDWKPLVLGLFPLGLGALAAAWELRDGCATLASMWGASCGPGDACYAIAVALAYMVWGLIIALAGGLFTAILRWHNPRARARDREEAETEG